jgi:hypothetical protein
MPLLAFKLLLTPLFIGGVTLAGRRWGPTVGGLLVGLPLTSGPVSVFLAIQYGPAFAARAAAGILAGHAATCLFLLTYGLLSGRLAWPRCAGAALLAFFGAVAVLDRWHWTLGSLATGALVWLGSRGAIVLKGSD